MDTKTTKKKKLSLLSFLWKGLGGGLLLFALAGCPGESPIDNPDDPNNPETPVNVVMQNIALTGTVKDAGGNPLSGVKVTTGSVNATTGSDGKFSFTQAGTVNSRAVIKFEKSGYFTLTRSGNKADEMNVEVMMSPKGNTSNSLQADLDASTAKTLQIGGVKIELPASCFVDAKGAAYSGAVRVDVLNLGSGNANTALMIPGGDLATDKSDEMMLPVGMVDAVFTDNAGNLLKIKDNTNVKMTWPAPSGVTNLPSSIPLWTFDEARGIWLEEGSATLQGNVYTGTVSHFTPKGAGRRSKTAIMQIHATECDDKPAAGASVTFYDVYNEDAMLSPLGYDFLWMTYFTNGKGDCSVTVPKSWSKWTVNVSYKGQSKGQAFTQGNMGGQSVYFKFDNGCTNEFPERFAVLAIQALDDGGEDITRFITYDSYGMRFRYDDDQLHIYDGFTSQVYSWHEDEKKWEIAPATLTGWAKYVEIIAQEPGNGWGSIGGLNIANSDKWFDNHPEIYTRGADETICGKVCRKYTSKFDSFVIFKWERIILRLFNAGKPYYEVLRFTESKDIPTGACTMSYTTHPWIK